MRAAFPLTLLLIPQALLAHDGRAVPADIWSHWNTDPLILIGLLLPTYLYMRGAMTYRVNSLRTTCFVGGMLTLFIALISPFDAMSTTLFSSHMLQHLLFVLLAAPLLVVSRPTPVLLRGLPLTWGKSVGRVLQSHWLQVLRDKLSAPLPVSFLHIAFVWLWHIPALYSAVLSHPLIHALQHASFFLSAVFFWWMIFHSENYGVRVLAVFIVMMTTGVLGALMTFATAPWYVNHSTYASEWGLTLLQDQQLAGLFMWIPPGVIYVVTAGLLLAGWLNAVEQSVLRREHQLMKELSDA